MDDITKYLIGWNIINNLAYNTNRYKIWNMYISIDINKTKQYNSKSKTSRDGAVGSSLGS